MRSFTTHLVNEERNITFSLSCCSCFDELYFTLHSGTVHLENTEIVRIWLNCPNCDIWYLFNHKELLNIISYVGAKIQNILTWLDSERHISWHLSDNLVICRSRAHIHTPLLVEDNRSVFRDRYSRVRH